MMQQARVSGGEGDRRLAAFLTSTLKPKAGCRENKRLVVLLLGLLWWNVSLVQAQPTVAPEYSVKAVFLYNFIQFIEWPSQWFPGPTEVFYLCVLGRDPFGPALDALTSEQVKGRPLGIRRLETLMHISPCHVLFISESEEHHLPQIFRALGGKGILTVGDTDGFVEMGGIIQFLSNGKKLRFAINVAAAQRAHLIISSKLLKLARIIGE